MGPKYEFSDETMNYDEHLLHRIRRLSDGKLGGWIEKEENLSQEGNCWVDDEAKVYDNAKVYGNAHVFNFAKIFGNAKVYGDALVDYWAHIYDNAQVYDDVHVWGRAEIYGDAHVYGYAWVYGDAKVYGDSWIYGTTKVYGDACSIRMDSGEYSDDGYKEDSSKEVIQDFIYKVNDSNKLTAQTEYDSVDEFFSEPIKNDVKLDTLIICTIDAKEPLIKLQKVEAENKTEFKFIVDITNEDGDNFTFKSIIKSQEQLNQLVQQTIEALKNYSKFSKYIDDLENCL